MKKAGKVRNTRRRGRAGQAIAELVVGLIAMTVLIMGMLLIEELARTHTHALNLARAQAGQDAVQTPYILRNSEPIWIGDWSTGHDKIQYSQDDQPVSGNPSTVTAGIVAHAKPGSLSNYAPGNEVSGAASSKGLMDELYLTHGRESVSVDLAFYPIIRHAVYGVDSITMQGDAWMTWTHIENVK